ncbi:hypothetical protein MLD38_011836 [Melastoma candidum]|uniref:Uncharacterized protein n=1 Tax=Melastoma candidum TaxID=119954 RepID=A0ACB9R657_9MYRT|nr:hypothetical protein MLD38_011836 [Melastoma candidum]
MATKYENSRFSSSFSDLFSRKLKLPSSNQHYGHSVNTIASHFEEEEPFASLEEIEARTIGNLLPNDDELLSGITDGIDISLKHSVDAVEELDFFSHVGGMDLEDDGSNSGQKYNNISGGIPNGHSESNSTMLGERSHGEHPSRTLFVRNIDSSVEDSELQALFERYGEIHSLYTACKHRGFIMISFYDIRAAHDAMTALQGRPFQRRNLDIHYSVPKDNSTEEELKPGVLELFDLDPSVSDDELRHIFCEYGEIIEIWDGALGSRKYVEFYDIRAAEAAFHALNMNEIAGRRIKVQPVGHVEPGRLVPHNQDSENNDGDLFLQQNTPIKHYTPGFAAISSPINQTALRMETATGAPFLRSTLHHGISSCVPSSLPSLVRVESGSKRSGFVEPLQPTGQWKYNIHATPSFHPHSLPEYQDALGRSQVMPTSTLNGSGNSGPPLITNNWHMSRTSSEVHSLDVKQGAFGSAGSGSCPIPLLQYMWGNSYGAQPPNMMWQRSPSFVNGISHLPPRMQGFLAGSGQAMNKTLPRNSLHVGSAPAVNHMPWERQTIAAESSEASNFHPGSLDNGRCSENPVQSMEFIHHSIFPHINGNCMDFPVAPKVMAPQSPERGMIFPGRGQMLPVSNSFDLPNGRFRSRRNDGASYQTDNKKQFELDIDRIVHGEDKRTTLMIKNIPNKYTSKMLLAAIDERHRGTYDFLYLPIDFKNKCNVGYAFINMTEPSQIIAFHEAFNGKKWEKFNSEKVASLAYARIQGKSALIAHFQNSSLMNEDKRCRPILLNTEGPNAGDQVPFPMGVNIRTRTGKARTNGIEGAHQGSPPFGSEGEYGKANGLISSEKDSN